VIDAVPSIVKRELVIRDFLDGAVDHLGQCRLPTVSGPEIRNAIATRINLAFVMDLMTPSTRATTTAETMPASVSRPRAAFKAPQRRRGRSGAGQSNKIDRVYSRSDFPIRPCRYD
jgi:hypothetical protein